jgi:hypothetical protein
VEEGGGEMRHLHYRRHILVSLFSGFVTTLIVVALLRVVWNINTGVAAAIKAEEAGVAFILFRWQNPHQSRDMFI